MLTYFQCPSLNSSRYPRNRNLQRVRLKYFQGPRLKFLRRPRKRPCQFQCLRLLRRHMMWLFCHLKSRFISVRFLILSIYKMYNSEFCGCSARRPAILAENLRGFPQYVHANAGLVPWIRPQPLPFQIVSNSSFTYHTFISQYIIWDTEELSLNKRQISK
jgi:hypothetical protein